MKGANLVPVRSNAVLHRFLCALMASMLLYGEWSAISNYPRLRLIDQLSDVPSFLVFLVGQASFIAGGLALVNLIRGPNDLLNRMLPVSFLGYTLLRLGGDSFFDRLEEGQVSEAFPVSLVYPLMFFVAGLVHLTAQLWQSQKKPLADSHS